MERVTGEARISTDRVKWRTRFGDMWTEVATHHAPNGLVDHDWASVRNASRDGTAQLVAMLRAPEEPCADYFDQALSAAALALEEAATDPVLTLEAGESSRIKLLRQLEINLAEHEEAVLMGAASYAETATTVLNVVHRVELAAIAVRVACNIKRFGSPGGPNRELNSSWLEYLGSLDLEVESTVDRVCAEWGNARRNGTAWIRTISMPAPLEEMRQIGAPGTDRTLLAEALLAVRLAWLRRAAGELLILNTMTSGPSYPGPQLCRSLHDAAARLLNDGQLDSRPRAFDHRGAWAHDQAALHVAMRDFLDTSECDWSRRDRRPRAALLENVARAWAAIVLIDARLGDRALGYGRT